MATLVALTCFLFVFLIWAVPEAVFGAGFTAVADEEELDFVLVVAGVACFAVAGFATAVVLVDCFALASIVEGGAVFCAMAMPAVSSSVAMGIRIFFIVIFVLLHYCQASASTFNSNAFNIF